MLYTVYSDTQPCYIIYITPTITDGLYNLRTAGYKVRFSKGSPNHRIPVLTAIFIRHFNYTHRPVVSIPWKL